jgi:hypothetical protein
MSFRIKYSPNILDTETSTASSDNSTCMDFTSHAKIQAKTYSVTPSFSGDNLRSSIWSNAKSKQIKRWKKRLRL